MATLAWQRTLSNPPAVSNDLVPSASLPPCHAGVGFDRRCSACSSFTDSGAAARHVREHIEAGMLGINIGVAGPMAFFPFNGIKGSFFGDLHAMGKDGVRFFTENKVEAVRWFSRPEAAASVDVTEAGA